jgi:hypothetical protein
VVEAVGSRRAAGASAGAADTCSGLSRAGGRTFAFAIVTPVEWGAKVEAVGTSAFEVEAAAEVPRAHCYPRLLAAYAADEHVLEWVGHHTPEGAHTWRTA